MAEIIVENRAVRLCRCTAHGQKFHGFSLPVGSLYGKDESGCFVITSVRRQYSTYCLQKQVGNGVQYVEKLRAALDPFELKVRRLKTNPFWDVVQEWHDPETEPEASSLWNAVTAWFDTITNANDPRLEYKPFKAERKENTYRAEKRAIYQEAKRAATGLRQPKPPETNIFWRGGRHASLDAWNGNI